MRRRAGVLPTALLAAVLVSGCGFPTQRGPAPVAVEEQPASLITEPDGGRPSLENVSLWFVHDDLLTRTTRRVPSPADAAAVVALLAAGVSKSESEQGIRSAIPSADMVVGAELAAGRANVELAPEFLDIPAGDQVLALAQLVYTLTDLRGVGRVRFIIEDSPVVVPLPAGDSTEDSVSRDDFSSLAAP